MSETLQDFGPVPCAPGFRFERHSALESTNTRAMDLARAGEVGGLWVLADVQTGGRGRRGRAWVSPKGNLFASVLLIDPGPRERLGELPMVAAVALAEAVDRAVGSIGLARLKWPNDLLVDGGKLSGILLEAQALSGGRTGVVCGFGVNVVAHPQIDAYATTDLTALGFRVSAEMMFERLAEQFALWLGHWQRDGFEPVREAWMKRALRLGEKIAVRMGEELIEGRFAEIDERGQMVLVLGNGNRKTISAGDVFFGTTS